MAFLRREACFVLIFAVLSLHPCPSLVHAIDKGHKGKITMLADHKYHDALISGIRNSNKEITGCFFLFKASESRGNLPMAIVRELIAARRRGVTVSIELEQDAGGKGTVYEQNRKAATLMSEAGIKVRFDAPKKITHVKAMVIDGRYVYIGSHNLTHSALKFNNELSVMVDSPELAAEVNSYLDNL
jgi:phosphatidylserine/phosphatidylglycerophosphate/cardiolipin synthase-like enzyme